MTAPRILFTTLVALLTMYSALLLYGSILPFEWYAAYIATTTLKYKLGARFTPDHYEVMIIRMRVIAAIILLIATSSLLFRQTITVWLRSLLESWRRLIQQWRDNASSMFREDKYYLLLLLCFTIGGLFLRLIYINQPMRLDESFTHNFHASQSWPMLLSVYLQPNNQLTHTNLVRCAILLFGNDPWIIRLPVLFFGTLMIPTVYFVIRRFFGRNVAIVTSGIVATSHIMILFSTNARGYIILTFLFLLLLITLNTLRTTESHARWSVFVILGILSAYTVPSALYPFSVACVWFLLSVAVGDIDRPRKGLLRNFLLSCIAVGIGTFLLYSPVLAISGTQPLYTDEFGNMYMSRDWQTFLSRLEVHVTKLRYTWHEGISYIGLLTLVSGVIFATIFHRRVAKNRIPLLVAVAIGIVPLVLIQRVSPYDRTWLFLYPIYVALAFAGLFYFASPTRRNAVILLTGGVFLGLASLIPLPWIKIPLDLLASDGDAAGVLSSHTRKMMADIRLLGIALVILGCVAMWVVRYSSNHVFRFAYVGLIAVVISTWQGANVIAQETVFRSGATGTFREAEPVSEYLSTRIRSDDTIVLYAVMASPLEYAFLRRGLPLEALRYTHLIQYPDFLAPIRVGEPLPDRFYVVTNEDYRQTVDDILASLEAEPGVTLEGFGDPALVKEFPESKIYQMARQTAHTTQDTPSSD